MTRAEAYLASALKIIDLYRGDVPFANWLKDYFKANKKFGSTDRKRIAELCYLYYRVSGLQKFFSHWPNELCIKIAIGLIQSDPNHWTVSLLDPDVVPYVSKPLEDKAMRILNFDPICLVDLFPYYGYRFGTAQIDHREHSLSLLHQPDMFLRIRPGKKELVLSSLQAAGITYQLEDENVVRLANGTKLEGVIETDRDAVVQDRSSQRTGEVIYTAALQMAIRKCFSTEYRNKTIDLVDIPIKVWDCCAASGGKSIQLMDTDLNIKLTVSDIRNSILTNLKSRFKTTGIEHYQSEVLDLEQPIPASHPLSKKKFDLIIADVPCSGSGTWSRTPEQIRFYDRKTTKQYQEKQRKIVKHAAKQMEKEAMLVYITCSIFEEENQQQVEYIKRELGLRLVNMQYHIGFNEKADNLFSAVFTNTPPPPRNIEHEKKLAAMDERYAREYKQSLLADNPNGSDKDSIGKL